MAYLKPDKIYSWNGVKVNEYLLTEHNDYKISMPTTKLPNEPLGITVHNTAAISVNSATTMAEQYTRATRNGNMNSVRVHFYIDDKCVWQNLPLDLSSWHAADGSGNGNRKTISMEIIGDSKKAEANAAKIIAYLMKKYDWNVEDNLFTHTHWLNVQAGRKGTNEYLNTTKLYGKKYCPAYILPHWSEFKNSIRAELNKLTGAANDKNSTSTQSKPAESKPAENKPTELYRVRKSWAEASTQMGAFASLENAKAVCKPGYSVFDSTGKEVYTPITVSDDKPEITKPEVSTVKTPDVIYRVYSGGKWLGEITNYNATSSSGYAGKENSSVRGVVAKTSKGQLRYRVHVKGGGWLSWISQYNPNNWSKGCAGLRSKDIDAIQFDLQDCEGFEVKYRTSTLGSTTYLPWVEGFNTTKDDGYAGIFGKSIDKLQIQIIKK